MRIGIFNEPKGLDYGGTEFCVATLAEALSDRHEVVILHRKEEMPLETLERFYGAPLPSVKVARAPDCPKTGGAHSIIEPYHDRKWTADYDVFVAVTHNIPAYCWARAGILIVLFPVGLQPTYPPETRFPRLRRAREALARWFWKKRMESYQSSLAISEYAREWTSKYWGVECGILHPPCRMLSSPAPKEDLILSVGRFAPLKRQDALMKAYRSLEPHIPRRWSYHCVGPLGRDEESLACHREVVALARGTRAEVRTNLAREALDAEFQRAAIFWHGAGEAGGGECAPVLAEHFGITTVEAMSAGCVPLAYNKGGQCEIIEHGVSGFLWDTIEALLSQTRELMADRALRGRMAAAAVRRAQVFSQEAFVTRFQQILEHSVKGRQ